MESFHWGKNFITGLAEVDDQHHHLVNIINQFGSSLSKNTINIKDIDILYAQLAEYAVYHFAEEEQLMFDIKIHPHHLKNHLAEHRDFLRSVTTIYATIAIDNLTQAQSFLKFLIHWLARHILRKDQNMARQINSIKAGMSPQEAYEEIPLENDNATEPLLEALNSLFEQVATRNKELHQLNESLDKKVAARTQELLQANQHLEELSLTDTLTELPNRRHAMRYLASCWKEALQTENPLVCMLVDADHFKEVNDTYGHDAGDVVLIELAKTLQHCLRNDDIVCRLGGDEFFIICPNTDQEGGMYVAELTRKVVSALRIPIGAGFWIGSISIGVACRLPNMQNYEELIKEADKGVYLAKKAGKNCVRSVL